MTIQMARMESARIQSSTTPYAQNIPIRATVDHTSSEERVSGRCPKRPWSGPAIQLGKAAVERGTRIDGPLAANTAVAAITAISTPIATHAATGAKPGRAMARATRPRGGGGAAARSSAPMPPVAIPWGDAMAAKCGGSGFGNVRCGLQRMRD